MNLKYHLFEVQTEIVERLALETGAGVFRLVAEHKVCEGGVCLCVCVCVEQARLVAVQGTCIKVRDKHDEKEQQLSRLAIEFVRYVCNMSTELNSQR